MQVDKAHDHAFDKTAEIAGANAERHACDAAQDNRSDARGDKELDRVLEIVRSEDAAEGISALLDGRKPRWFGE